MKTLVAGTPAVELAQKGHRPLYVRTLSGHLHEVQDVPATLERASRMDAYARWIYCVYVAPTCANCDGEGRIEPGGCPVCFKVGRVQEDSAS